MARGLAGEDERSRPLEVEQSPAMALIPGGSGGHRCPCRTRTSAWTRVSPQKLLGEERRERGYVTERVEGPCSQTGQARQSHLPACAARCASSDSLIRLGAAIGNAAGGVSGGVQRGAQPPFGGVRGEALQNINPAVGSGMAATRCGGVAVWGLVDTRARATGT